MSTLTATAVVAGTQTIAGVPVELGQSVHVNTRKQLQRQINSIVGWNELDRAPMTVAQTMLRGSEHQVGEHPYFVCEKSVGIRYLVLLVQGHCYLISQNYDFREVTLFCPVRPDRLQPGVDRNTVVPHQWTILDGLLVCDKDGTKSVLTLLLYDILALNGSPVMTSKLQDRLKLIQNDVVGPRKQLPLPKGHPPDMFQLVLQSMYPIDRVGHVIRSILPRVSQTRQNAGLVFTPVLLPYTPGHSKGLFHWTPAAVLFADFQLGVEWRGRPPKAGFKLVIHDKRTQVFQDWITFTPGMRCDFWRLSRFCTEM
uniref:mRNA capping enzyme adenylation domain-containing protein n=1 Tax=Hyaloperonospora arabidopsidis (strain Emoy2) TaxID=559515 RepID=M4B2A4_HYAAE